MEELELKTLKKYIKNKKNIYMFFGFDKNDQYSSLTELNTFIKNISKDLKQNSIIYYFGDQELPSKEKPDIDYVISEIKNRRTDIELIMLAYDNINDSDIPVNIISKILKIPVKTPKKRGVNNNSRKPLGLTKLWFDLNKIQKIEKIFILGGNDITLEEVNIAKELELNIEYYPIKRKFLGDSKTTIKKNATHEEKLGVTYILE
jgi:hypothetical protein